MHSKNQRRTRTTAFAIGAACLVLELLMLVGMSRATAPEGRAFAGDGQATGVGSTEVRPVILLRKIEVSL